MCNKTLAKTIHKSYTNGFSIHLYNHIHSPIQSPKTLGFSNPKTLLGTTALATRPRSSNYVFSKSFLFSDIDGYECKSYFAKSSPLTSVTISRLYSTDKPKLPKLMNFPQVIWPSVFKTIRNWILSNFIIMRYFDNEFNLPDFVNGSKQAIELVSGHISRGDVESLNGLVTPEVISIVKESLEELTLKQRQDFGIKQEDIFFSFPYEVGVMFPNENKSNVEGENQSRFVEITMCYHAFRGLKEFQETGMPTHINMGAMPEHYDKIFICNYRFIREFTKGVQDDWTINAINHFKPALEIN